MLMALHLRFVNKIIALFVQVKNEKNIVFGGQGFIGQNLCSQLIKMGKVLFQLTRIYGA